ncbi:MAG: UDP-N-acetylmuramate dehydrogenase [Patescibacteria group bacterium]
MKFKDLTTFKIGGSIRYFFRVSDLDDLIEKVLFAKRRKLPIFVIGEGSNILVSDKYYNGVVIRYVENKIEINNDIVTAKAGVIWDKLVKFTVDNTWQGVECLSGIPGTVGASPIQNIGAYGQELSDTFISLKAYDIQNERLVVFNKNECKFGYRESIFKQQSHWQKYVILEVSFKLKKFEGVDLLKSRNDILKLRKQKLEDPKKVPNAGSFFKNPFVSLNKKLDLEKKYSDMQFYPVKNKYKISAGFLIEKAGWKGRKMGSTQVSPKHALILTNPDAKSRFGDVKKMADSIIFDVYKLFKIKLVPEVQYINT